MISYLISIFFLIFLLIVILQLIFSYKWGWKDEFKFLTFSISAIGPFYFIFSNQSMDQFLFLKLALPILYFSFYLFGVKVFLRSVFLKEKTKKENKFKIIEFNILQNFLLFTIVYYSFIFLFFYLKSEIFLYISGVLWWIFNTTMAIYLFNYSYKNNIFYWDLYIFSAFFENMLYSFVEVLDLIFYKAKFPLEKMIFIKNFYIIILISVYWFIITPIIKRRINDR